MSEFAFANLNLLRFIQTAVPDDFDVMNNTTREIVMTLRAVTEATEEKLRIETTGLLSLEMLLKKRTAPYSNIWAKRRKKMIKTMVNIIYIDKEETTQKMLNWRKELLTVQFIEKILVFQALNWHKRENQM